MTDLTVSTVRAIGTGENKKQDTAVAVVSAMPVEYDWTARGAVAAAIRTACGIDKASEPAQKTGPKGEQAETAYGVGFRVLSDAVRALVKVQAAPEAGVIRVSLSGEGGSTLTLREGDEGYALALALFGTGEAVAA
jgi:hypothetical protein